MSRFVLLALLVLWLAWYFLRRKGRHASPPQWARRIRQGIWLGGAGLLVFLAVTGRLHWLFGLLGVVLPLFQQVLVLLRHRRRFQRRGRSQPRVSTIETRLLRMSLDHGHGRLDGVVLGGAHRGRRLGELNQVELLEVLRQCRVEDGDGARLLEAYLDRRFGPAWRNAATAGKASGQEGNHQHGARRRGDDMTVEEAREILGVGPQASPAEIRRAHRRLMQKYHPDRGGSNQLAARINRAKEVLLGRGHKAD